MNRFTRVAVSICLASCILAPASDAFALTNDQESCSSAMNKAGAKVAATQGKENSSCVKDAAEVDVDACIVADTKDKVSGAQQKTTDTQSSKCGAPFPGFGYSGAVTTNSVTVSEEIALLEAIFGSDVDSAMLADHDGAGCQSSVTKSYEKLASTRMKAFNACKKDGYKNSLTTALQLQGCMDDDPKLKVSGARSKLGDTVTGKCAGVTLATAFPGCSAQAGDATALTNCVARNVECHMCLMTNAMDNISTPCDQHDDGVVNQTCRQCGNGAAEAPEACDTAGDSVSCDSDCTLPSCGDGHVNAAFGDICDAGTETAACDDDCTLPSCGDGNLNTAAGEVCDDGNANNGDGCDNNCTVSACGNGITAGSEGCDDGNNVNTDACLNSCVVATCGDGVKCNGAGCTSGPTGGAEACDDGDGLNTNSCLTNCAAASCGDGNLCSAPGCTSGPTGSIEQCDNAGANNNATPDACRTNCKLPSCGDAVTDTGEGCDDGNAINTDHCLNSCVIASCGDGVKCNGAGCVSGPTGGAEACDDANAINTDNCLTNCAAASCGDGFLCSALGCTSGPSGGVEQCDNDGSNSNVTPNACRTSCRTAFCGDNVTDAGETCDGGGVNTPTCDSNCTSAACGDGFVNSAASETCDGGGETSSCDANCTARVCGDGTINVTAGEDCDDGNAVSGDGCSSTCQSGPGSGESDAACPNLGELVLFSHESQISCTDNTDCDFPRTCDTSILPTHYCTSVGDLDSGWTGTAHNSDINDGVLTKATLVCEGPATPGCGECTIGGISPEPGNCRCANNVRTICGDPFSASSDCPACSGGVAVAGNTCASNTDCSFPTCAGRCSVNVAVTCTTNADCTAASAGSTCSTSSSSHRKKCANGAFCDVNADCTGTCTGQDTCECFFGAPFPLNSGGTAACIVNRFANDISGTANVDLGAGDITANLRTRVYLGITQSKPCPVCGGKCSQSPTKTCANNADCTTPAPGGTCGSYDDVLGDGVRNGTCSGGANTNQSCDASATNATFPAKSGGQLPGGGYYSIDCQPSVGLNVSGTGLSINLEQTTGLTSLSATLDCDAGGVGTDLCPCLECSKDTTVPCNENADCTGQGFFCSAYNNPVTFSCTTNANCTSVDTGTCTGLSGTKCSNALSRSCTTNADCGMQSGGTCTISSCTSPGIGEVPKPNKCNGGVCNDIGDGFNGECATGPDQGYCDGLLRIDGRGMNTCASNSDCTATSSGLCTLSERQLCFLDPIEAQGDPDPVYPVAGSVFCVPPTENSAINGVAGLPGPGRVISQGAARTFCASNADVEYVPGGVPACP